MDAVIVGGVFAHSRIAEARAIRSERGEGSVPCSAAVIRALNDITRFVIGVVVPGQINLRVGNRGCTQTVRGGQRRGVTGLFGQSGVSTVAGGIHAIDRQRALGGIGVVVEIDVGGDAVEESPVIAVVV